MRKSSKNRKKRSTNMSGALLKELQALIAFACYDSPSLIRRGASLPDTAIENVMASIYYGNAKNGADPDLISYDDQLMLGLNKFKGLYTQSLQTGPNASSGEVLLSIPEYLHRHKKLFVFVGDGSIEKGILSQKSLLAAETTGEKISGRTLHRIAKAVLCNCKKMMAIVKSKGSPYKDGKFPSGTNWEDYILWCLVEMGKDCERAEAEKIDSIAGSGDIEKGQEEQEGLVIASSSTSDSLSDNNYYYPDGTFFKCGVGFLAWALWGHIPIHDSACMQSDSFGDGKINASFGRKTASRAQMRKLLIEQNAATVDNRRGRKSRAADEEEADNNL